METYEKKYKEANDKIAARFGTNVAKEIFTDLYESEDEKIRKAIIELVKQSSEILSKQNQNNMLTWLEKQGYTKKDVDDAYLKGICNTKHELEKQDEQKPQRMVSAEAKEALYDKPTDEEMKELLRTEYEKGRADTIAEMEKDWSEEDDVMINKLLAVVKLYYDRSGDDLDKQSCISFLKSLKDKVQPQPKQEWSEEDEDDLNNIIWLCNNCINGSETTWIPSQAIRIKSLIERIKDTVFLHPKQEWNEEDEKMVGNIRSIIEKYAFSQSAVDVNGDLCEKIYIDADNWIKSIKQRIGG